MSCYFANDGNGTFAVISIRDLMEMIEDWRRYEGETAPVPSAEAVLRLIRMRKR